MPAASLVLFAALGLSEGSSSLRASVASTALLLLQGIRLGHVVQRSEAHYGLGIGVCELDEYC